MGKRRKRLRRAEIAAANAAQPAKKVTPKPVVKPKPVKAPAPVAHAADLVSPRSPKLTTASPLPKKKVSKK